MNRHSQYALGGCAAASLLIVMFPSIASAHALGAEAKLKDGKVAVEAFYDDDTPAETANVLVTDQSGKVIGQGKTDKEGRWSFPAPPAGQYSVSVDAGAGHRATVVLIVPQRATQTATPGESTPFATPSEEGMQVSEGLSRSEFTGWRRVILAVVGVIVIGGGTFGLSWLLRAVKVSR